MNMIAPDAMRYRAPCLTVRHAALARALSRQRGVRDADGFALRVAAPPAQIAAPRSFGLTLGGAVARVTLPGQLVDDLLTQLDPVAQSAAPDVAALFADSGPATPWITPVPNFSGVFERRFSIP